MKKSIENQMEELAPEIIERLEVLATLDQRLKRELRKALHDFVGLPKTEEVEKAMKIAMFDEAKNSLNRMFDEEMEAGHKMGVECVLELMETWVAKAHTELAKKAH